MASKSTYQAQSQGTLTDDEFFARLDAVAGVKQEAAEKPKESAGVLRTAGDLGLKAAQGVVGLGQAAIGLGNLATGGLVGKGMRRAGYDPERTNQAIGEYLSDSQKESDRKVQEADGFFGTAQAMLENPRSIIGGAAQSAPGMLLGGGMTSAVARRIGAAAAAPLGGLQTPAGQAAAKAAVEKAAGRLMLTGSSAEGVQAAGQIAEKAEREGRGWGDYVLPSVGAGIGTAAIGRATGKLMGDSETAIFSGAKSAAAKGSLPVRVVKSGASEGIEETLQSGQQQSMENIALGKEWDDEIDKAMGQGLVVGSAMGLGTGAFTRADNARQQQAVASAQQSGGIVSRAGLAATPGAQQPSPAAPNPAATQPTAAAAPGTAGQPAAAPTAGPTAPAQPAQTPIQASALSAIEQALEADKQRRRAAGEVVEDEVEEVDVVAAGNPAAVDPPDAAPPPAMQAQPAQTPAQPASAGFSSPKFDNSPIPKMEPAEAAEQRRQATEAQDRRRKRVAALRLGAYNKNPMMEFLGRHGLQPEEQNEFAPGNTERRKAAVYGYGPVFRKNGKPLDLLLANAQDEGFLPPDSSESDLRDLVSRTINGERVEPLYKAGIADDLMQRLAAEREAKEAASYEDYLREHGQAVESGDFDPLDSIGTTGYDFGDDDLADYAASAPLLQAEVSALAQHYYDLGFDPDEVLERLSIETENQPEQAYYDLAKSRFTQLIEQALSPGRREGSTEQGGGGAVRRDAGQASAAQADGSAAGGQAAAVTPPAAPAAAQPRRADAIRAKLDDLKAQGFSQFTRSSGRTLLLNPDTYETVELTPAEMAVARKASGQARAGLQSLRGQRNPAQVDQQGVDVLQSYTPADVLTQEERASQQQAADQAERDKAQAQARADDERRRIEQASYAAADSFELGQNPLDSLTGQKDIFGAAPVAQGLAGERINDEWTAFDPQSGTLGIPRAEMPQIKAEHRGAMMGFLKARGIDGQQETIPSAAIKPTQAEFSPAKVKKALDREGGSRSIIVSADGYVVDGHHQWLAAREKGEPIQAIRLDQNIGDVLAALKDMPSAQPEQAPPDRELKSGPAAVPPPEFASFEAKKALLELSQELVSAEGGLNERGNALARTPWGELSESDRVLALKLSQDKQASNDASNARVREGMRQIRRQLQNERTITQANSKPFKTEAGAKAMLDQFDLGDTHKIVSEGGGYALRQMPPAEQAEVRRKAEGRESYMEAQAAVITEMGIPSTADGEIDATDEQWDEIDQRIAERLGQKPIKAKSDNAITSQLSAIAGELDAVGATRRAAIVREWMSSDLSPSAGDVQDAQDLLDQVKKQREPDPVAELLNQHFKLSSGLTEAFNSGKGDAKNQLRLMDESDQATKKLIELGYTQDQLGANALGVTVDHFKEMVKDGLYSREYGARDELFKKAANLPPAMAADEAPDLTSQWASMTPDQRRRSRLEREIATGMTNNGGVMARLRPSAIEKRKQDLAAMRNAGKQPAAAPAQQDGRVELTDQVAASQPSTDQPIASKPFATSIEKTKTGWAIKGDPDALAEHARYIFGKGVVKRKDGISLATKTDDVAGNFPARFDEYRLADLPERHGRIEVRVNQDGSASVRSLDGGYMGPQLPSVAEAIANHRKTFGGSDSSVKQTDVQPAGSTAAATKATQMKTVRDVADKLGMEYVSGLLADSLKKGQTFDMLGKQYAVTTVTDSRIRLKSSDGKTIEALKYGNKLVSGGNAKSQPYAQFVRDLEGVISVDLINESNPFHKPSEVFVLAQRALDALPADMKAVRPEGAAGAGNADQAETGREGYDTPVELDAAQLKAILEQTRGEPLVDKPAKLEAWRNGTAKTDPAKFPIELVFRPDGRLDVNDGRHRIALAAERGEKVTAFIDGKDAQRARDLLAGAQVKQQQKYDHGDFGFMTRSEAEAKHALFLQLARDSRQRAKDAPTKFLKNIAEESASKSTILARQLKTEINYRMRQFPDYRGEDEQTNQEALQQSSSQAIQDFIDGKIDRVPTLEEVQADTLDKLEKELADWQVRRELPINQGQIGVIDEEIAKLQAQVDALRGATGQEDRRPSITVNPDLEAIFDQLDGITQRTQAAGQQAAAAHPQAERIQFVQKHILDILEDLEDSGKVTINC